MKSTRWLIAHRRLVIVTWVAVVVAIIAASQGAGKRTSNDFSLPHTGSQRALDLLQSRFPAQAGDIDQIVFRSRIGKLTDESVRGAIVPLLGRLSELPHVVAIVSPYARGAHAISKSGAIGFASIEFDEQAKQLPLKAVDRVIDAAEAARSPRLEVELGGPAIRKAEQPSLGFATAVGIGAAVIVLLLGFGSLLAMSLPIVTALLGLGAGLGLIGLGSHLVATPDISSDLALMIGLGVGIDYSLFLLTRYRDAYRENGGDVAAAVELAMATAGRAVLFAGTTVVIALLGMIALGISFLYGVVIAASLGVLLVLAAALTLLPALLTLTGHRLGHTRRRRRKQESTGGFWTHWIDLIQRRPAWAALISTAVLLALALPALDLRLGANDSGNDPVGHTTRKAYDLLAAGFGSGFNGPLELAVRLPDTGKQAALDRITSTLHRTRGVASVAAPRLNGTRDTAAITVYPVSAPQSAETTRLVRRLRRQVLPPLANETGTKVYVGGVTAIEVDFAHALARKLPLFLGIVIALSMLLLLVVFRSLLIPLQAALMNLLSIAAALGVVQALFERGWLGGPLGIQPGPIDAFIPVLVFALVFGLSMDYEVFLVSRVREEWQRDADATAAVREGLARTARVITAAAAVMITVFASFAAADDRVLKLFGISMAVAVFLDAILIRTVLLPAVLQLLGRTTWALPGWLDRRLPQVAVEPPPAEEPAPLLEEAA
jgi:putative drug exporter of the RND superfamily